MADNGDQGVTFLATTTISHVELGRLYQKIESLQQKNESLQQKNESLQQRIEMIQDKLVDASKSNDRLIAENLLGDMYNFGIAKIDQRIIEIKLIQCRLINRTHLV